jgi:hypothetical protein
MLFVGVVGLGYALGGGVTGWLDMAFMLLSLYFNFNLVR